MSLKSAMASLMIIFILVAVLNSGCATMMKDDTEELTVETQPAGALVKMGEYTCHSPCHLEVARQKHYDLTIEKPGFQPQKEHVTGWSWDPWLWGNLVFLFGLPIGVAVDFYTGKAYDLAPAQITTDLKKAETEVQ